jgi:predicted RNA-binding protein with PIN domain
MYIEKTTLDLGKHNRVRVATSDGMEQVIILGHNALRISARSLLDEVREVEREIQQALSRQ